MPTDLPKPLRAVVKIYGQQYPGFVHRLWSRSAFVVFTTKTGVIKSMRLRRVLSKSALTESKRACIYVLPVEKGDRA